MEKNLVFSAKVDEKALYRFQMYSVYHNMQGIVAVFISLLCFAYLFLKWNDTNIGMKILLVFLGLIYLVFKPIELLLKAKLLSKQEAFQLPIEFSCSDELIAIRQGEETAELPWENIWKIVVRKKDIYIYTGRLYAYTIPKDQVGDAAKEFLKMAEGKGCSIK